MGACFGSDEAPPEDTGRHSYAAVVAAKKKEEDVSVKGRSICLGDPRGYAGIVAVAAEEKAAIANSADGKQAADTAASEKAAAEKITAAAETGAATENRQEDAAAAAAAAAAEEKRQEDAAAAAAAAAQKKRREDVAAAAVAAAEKKRKEDFAAAAAVAAAEKKHQEDVAAAAAVAAAEKKRLEGAAEAAAAAAAEKKRQEDAATEKAESRKAVARQREGHPYVVLRKEPSGEKTFKVTNNTQLDVLEIIGDDAHVQVTGDPGIGGWSKCHNIDFEAKPRKAVAQQPEGHPYVVLRAQPSGEKTFKVPNDAQLDVLEIVDDHAHVQVVGDPGTRGWAKCRNIKLESGA